MATNTPFGLLPTMSKAGCKPDSLSKNVGLGAGTCRSPTASRTGNFDPTTTLAKPPRGESWPAWLSPQPNDSNIVLTALISLKGNKRLLYRVLLLVHRAVPLARSILTFQECGRGSRPDVVQRKRILLVDDDDELRGSLAEQLELHDKFVTDQATSGARALEIANPSTTTWSCWISGCRTSTAGKSAVCFGSRDSACRSSC